MAAADDPPGDEGLADGFVASRAQVVGEPAGSPI
jgi:hypothetical protein